jgi:Fe-Mn family superoxide dismutase
MAFELPPLPYAPDALAPYMSAQTLGFHHGKHHQTYVTNLNGLIKETPLADRTLEDIVRATAGDNGKIGVFNNAAQVWNHTFFWHSMKPQGGGAPQGELAERIKTDFGSLDAFKEEFKKTALAQFGSGWAWLVLENGKLKVVKTANAATPLTENAKALLTCDVWEHAYYLDYQNRRGDMVGAFLDNLVNWDFAAKNLA